MIKRFSFACLAALSLSSMAAAETDPLGLELLPGWTTDEGVVVAGLRIALAPGWKTYWRAPGEAGIPPQFSWKGSDNLKAVRIHWPAPEVFDTAGLRTIGYTGEVILPVELFPSETGQPIDVRGEAAMGVCKDICVPIFVEYGGPLDGTAPDHSAAIKRALDARPSSAQAAGAERVVCTAEPIRDGLRLTAVVSLPHQGGEEVAVLEFKRKDVWVSEPVTTRSGQTLTAVADLVPPEAAPFALDRSDVRMTVLGSDGAVDLIGCIGT